MSFEKKFFLQDNSLQEKSKTANPNLWKPPSLDKEKRPIVNQANMQSLVSAIFYKVGREEFGLQKHEFEVSLQLNAPYVYSIFGGPRVTVIWNVLPTERIFRETLYNCLQAIKATKEPTSIELYSRLKAYEGTFPKFPKGVPIDECEVEFYRIVKVIHKSGLVSIQYAKDSRDLTWSKLIAKATFEIQDGLNRIHGISNAKRHSG